MRVTASGVSIEEFLAGDFGRDAQLIAGEVAVNDPTFQHQRVAGLIYRRLADWSETVGSGLAGFGGNWTMAPGSSYKPDAWWVDDEQASTLVGARSERPPALAVEVRAPEPGRSTSA